MTRKTIIAMAAFMLANMTVLLAPLWAQEVQRLTYYVDGRRRTANVVHIGVQRTRFFLDNGGNIVAQVSFREAGSSSWHSWEPPVMIQRRIRGVDCVWGVQGFLSARKDFFSALYQYSDGFRAIMISQRNNHGHFIWVEGNFVHVLDRVYARR